MLNGETIVRFGKHILIWFLKIMLECNVVYTKYHGFTIQMLCTFKLHQRSEWCTAGSIILKRQHIPSTKQLLVQLSLKWLVLMTTPFIYRSCTPNGRKGLETTDFTLQQRLLAKMFPKYITVLMSKAVNMCHV